MDTYQTTRIRLLGLLEEHKMSIHSLAIKSGIAPSTIKNIIYGVSKNPGIVTIKMICDGFNISLPEFFDSELFYDLEQEIK